MELIRGHRWQKICEIIVSPQVHNACFKESDHPHLIMILSIGTRVADIVLQRGWEVRSIHAVWTTLNLAVNITVVFIGCMRLLHEKEVCAH